MTPQQYCQEKAGGSGSSFYYSFLFLDSQKRSAITALYAFCREVDDVVDECEHGEIAAAKLGWWREEIAKTFAGDPSHPVCLALQPAITTYGLQQDRFIDIIDGMAMDLTRNRYDTFEELQLYCYRVASAVGLLSAAIFGYTEDKTLEFAKDLGIAFQLTNIIRDVGEDARRDRIYLPREDLDRFQVSPADILDGKASEHFEAMMRFQGERAQRYYTRALDNLAEVDRLNQIPSLIMAAVYRANLAEIDADGYQVLAQKTTLPALRKLWLAWTTARRERALHRQRCKRSRRQSGMEVGNGRTR